MIHEAKNFDQLKGGVLKSLTDAQLEQHFTLYKGYIAKINEIEQKLEGMDNTKPNYSFNEWSELKRREAVAFNGSYLHELYFENLVGNNELSPDFQAALEAQGGLDKWVAELKAAALCGPGWALLTRNRRDGRLHTYFLNEHHIGLPVDQDILAVVDSWEHAFMVDYGIARAKYLDAIVADLNWKVISSRYSA